MQEGVELVAPFSNARVLRRKGEILSYRGGGFAGIIDGKTLRYPHPLLVIVTRVDRQYYAEAVSLGYFGVGQTILEALSDLFMSLLLHDEVVEEED